MKEPAIGVIELNSLARGFVVTDVMVKKAPVRIVSSHPICLLGIFATLIAASMISSPKRRRRTSWR